MDWQDIVTRLAGVAEDLAPMIAGEKGEAAVEIARRLIALADTIGDVLGTDDAAPLAEALPALQAAVTDYANQTAAALRGH